MHDEAEEKGEVDQGVWQVLIYSPMRNIKRYHEHVLESEASPEGTEYVLLTGDSHPQFFRNDMKKLTNGHFSWMKHKVRKRVSPEWHVRALSTSDFLEERAVIELLKTEAVYYKEVEGREAIKRPFILRFHVFPRAEVRHSPGNLDIISTSAWIGGKRYDIPFSLTGVYDHLTGDADEDSDVLSGIILEIADRIAHLIGQGASVHDIALERGHRSSSLRAAKKMSRSRGAFGRF